MRRTHELTKAFKSNLNSSDCRSAYNGPPRFAHMLINNRSQKIPIIFPKFIAKEDFINDNNLLFVEISKENAEVLNVLTSSIVAVGHQPERKYYDTTLDYKTPGIGAFRLNSNNSEIKQQVHVHKNQKYPNLFQLDIYEANTIGKMVLKQVGICDLSNYKHPEIQIVYTTFYSIATSNEYSAEIGTTFQDIMIFLRTWDYDLGIKYLEITKSSLDFNFPRW